MDDDKTTPVTVGAVWERVPTVRDHLASLAGTDLGVLTDDDVEGLLVAVEKTTRMLPVVQQSLVRQVRDRGLHADRQYKSPVPYLWDLLSVTDSDAAARVTGVERFHPRVAVTGEVLSPRFPHVAAAVAAGEISMHRERNRPGPGGAPGRGR